MKKRLTAASAAVLAVLVTAGAAFAVTAHQPTVSLDAHREGRRIEAKGVYDNVSPVCEGPGGRSVVIYANNAVIGGATTKASGKYSDESGRLKKGTYTVQSFVAGSVRGGYGADRRLLRRVVQHRHGADPRTSPRRRLTAGRFGRASHLLLDQSLPQSVLRHEHRGFEPRNARPASRRF